MGGGGGGGIGWVAARSYVKNCWYDLMKADGIPTTKEDQKPWEFRSKPSWAKLEFLC